MYRTVQSWRFIIKYIFECLMANGEEKGSAWTLFIRIITRKKRRDVYAELSSHVLVRLANALGNVCWLVLFNFTRLPGRVFF